MNCPVCGSTATRVSTNYWCPYDKIYLGHNLATNSSGVGVVTQVQYQEIVKEDRPLAKFFGKFLWVIMAVLYIVVIGFVAWAFIFGGFGDTSSLLVNKY